MREEEILALTDANQKMNESIKKMTAILRSSKLCNIYQKTLKKRLGDEKIKNMQADAVEKLNLHALGTSEKKAEGLICGFIDELDDAEARQQKLKEFRSRSMGKPIVQKPKKKETTTRLNALLEDTITT